MKLQLLHRRLTVGMGLVSLMAFAGGAGFKPTSALLAAVALSVAWVWQPDSATRDPVLSGRTVGVHHNLYLLRGAGGARLVPWQARCEEMRVI